VDRYDLLEEVGSGGMAVVYRGRDTALDREVAVKLLHPHLAARSESRARFSREARAVARLSHPNIVEIFDYAGDGAVESYLVTEFVRGRTLRTFAEQEGLGYPEIGVLVARALADALVHAHSAGVIHRDLKPENVLLLEDGGRRAVKLVDFGIARILASDERMTMTGALVGSPNHMAPEIVEGRDADARSDVFSLGTILYWLATGRMPFAAPNPTATLRRVIQGDFDDPRAAPLVSGELAALLGRAMAVDPARRHASAAELREALDALLLEVGLSDPPRELDAFLSDPQGYKAAFPPRLSAALQARATEALARGSSAQALRLWNRVLAVDPSNAAVLRDLAALERKSRLRRLARRAALAGAGLAAAGALLATALILGPPAFRDTPAAPPPAAAEPARPPDPAPSPPATEAPAPPAERAVARPADPHRRAPPAPPAPAPCQLSAHVRPYAQRALLDGVEVARDQQVVAVDLAPGRAHRLRIEHACCVPFVRDFPADAPLPPALELKVPLQPLPALLRVEAPAAAEVFVDGRRVGTAGDSQRSPLAVAVPTEGDSPYEAEAEIRIEVEGRALHVTSARLRAGAELTVVSPRSEVAP
jgi:serine/threonine-protein kinase